MTNQPAADAADATLCAAHHLEEARAGCRQAHSGKTQPNPEFSSPENAADHAGRAHFDLLETT